VALKSGSYAVKTEKTVVVWPSPDANGDGEEVWYTETDQFGQVVGQSREKDKHGNEVFAYQPPKGFSNRPGFDHTDNYVKVTDRGQVVRQPNGEAICIKPGWALIFNADGSVETLKDEYAQYLFSKAHDGTSTEVTDEPPADEVPA